MQTFSIIFDVTNLLEYIRVHLTSLASRARRSVATCAVIQVNDCNNSSGDIRVVWCDPFSTHWSTRRATYVTSGLHDNKSPLATAYIAAEHGSITQSYLPDGARMYPSLIWLLCVRRVWSVQPIFHSSQPRPTQSRRQTAVATSHI